MRVNYYVEPKSPLMRGAMAFFCLSFALRLIWAVSFPAELAGARLLIHGALPLGACVLFVLLLALEGERRLWLTFIPAAMGVLFFIVKATGFTPVHQTLCTLLYSAVAILYGTAVFGLAPIRRLLIPLFGLPLLYHIFVEDLILNRPVYTLSNWLQEGSVLCIMAALLLVSLGMKKR